MQTHGIFAAVFRGYNFIHDWIRGPPNPEICKKNTK